MKDILLAITAVAAASAVIGLFFDEGEELSKYIKLVSSLCFVCALVPFGINFFSKSDFSLPQFDSIPQEGSELVSNYRDAIIENAEKELETKLCALIFENFGINLRSIDIQFNVTEKEDSQVVEIKDVSIALMTNEKKDEIAEFIFKTCEVKPNISVTDDKGVERVERAEGNT